ncbi:hypothetical protein ACT2CV_01855 [Pasteurellaceae bacterium 22721_9_1]
MKLTKLFAGLMVAGVLGACTQNANSEMNKVEKATQEVKEVAGQVQQAMGSTQPALETAAYFCDVQGKKKQVVSVTYAFVNGKADSATVTVRTGNKKSIHELKVNPSYTDGTQFVDGKKVFTLDEGFSAQTVNKTVPVMLTIKDKIIAKNCTMAN